MKGKIERLQDRISKCDEMIEYWNSKSDLFWKDWKGLEKIDILDNWMIYKNALERELQK